MTATGAMVVTASTHPFETITQAAIAVRAVEKSARGGGVIFLGACGDYVVCEWVVLVSIEIGLISCGNAADVWNGAHGETGAGATLGTEGIIEGRAIAGAVDAGVVVVIE